MRIEAHTDATAFDTLGQEWNELLSHSISDTLFLTVEWQRAWWEAFGEGKTLLVLTARDDAGVLLAIAPLLQCEVETSGDAHLPTLSIEHSQGDLAGPTSTGIFLVGGTEVSDYLDFIVRPDALEPVYEGYLDFLIENVLGWDMIDLHSVPGPSPTNSLLGTLATRRGWSVAQEREDVCPVIDLPGTWDEYLSGLDKKARHEIRRKQRKLYREIPARYHVARDPAEFDGAMEDFFRLHEQSAFAKAGFWSPRMRSFFLDVAGTALRQGNLEISFLDAGDEPIATYLSFVYKGEYLVYNSGFDPVNYRALSPGIVLASHCIEDAISRGLKRVDLLQGDERYKYDLGGIDREVMRTVIRPAGE